jgi:hypothetical protein
MKNPEILKDAITKLVENLFLRSLNKEDYDLSFHPNFKESPAVYLEIDVDLERINSEHPKYDPEYAKTVYDMESIEDKLRMYLGLPYNKLQIFTTANYTNEDYVWGEIDFVRDSIKKHLLNKGYSRKDVNDLEVWVNLHTSDASPWVKLEVGSEMSPTTEQIEEIENSSYESLNKTKYLRSLVDGDIEFWHDY